VWRLTVLAPCPQLGVSVSSLQIQGFSDFTSAQWIFECYEWQLSEVCTLSWCLLWLCLWSMHIIYRAVYGTSQNLHCAFKRWFNCPSPLSLLATMTFLFTDLPLASHGCMLTLTASPLVASRLPRGSSSMHLHAWCILCILRNHNLAASSSWSHKLYGCILLTLVTQPNSYKVFTLWTKDTQSSRYYTKVVLSAQDWNRDNVAVQTAAV